MILSLIIIGWHFATIFFYFFFCLSAVCRSLKNLLFVFLQCAEAWKIHFLPFCSVQKLEKLIFCLSAACRSLKNPFFAFLQCAEAWKIYFWPFCNVQKLEKSTFCLSAACRSMVNPFLPVFMPAALKTAGNKTNKSNQSNYSETGRTEYAYDRWLVYFGFTLPR